MNIKQLTSMATERRSLLSVPRMVFCTFCRTCVSRRKCRAQAG